MLPKLTNLCMPFFSLPDFFKCVGRPKKTKCSTMVNVVQKAGLCARARLVYSILAKFVDLLQLAWCMDVSSDVLSALIATNLFLCTELSCLYTTWLCPTKCYYEADLSDLCLISSSKKAKFNHEKSSDWAKCQFENRGKCQAN